MRGIGFDPDVLLVGMTNAGQLHIRGVSKKDSQNFTTTKEQHRIKLGRYRAAFPRAALIDFPKNAVGVSGCSAEGEGLCTKRNSSYAGHQCSPGPLARVAERDADRILAALSRESRSLRYRCEGWCKSHSAPWAKRCAWDTQACAACSECKTSRGAPP